MYVDAIRASRLWINKMQEKKQRNKQTISVLLYTNVLSKEEIRTLHENKMTTENVQGTSVLWLHCYKCTLRSHTYTQRTYPHHLQ